MQKKKNIASPSTTQHHDTPNNKTHFIKFRVTEIEKLELEHTAQLLNLSMSTLIRRALHNVKIEKKIIVASSGEETLTAVSTLLRRAEYYAHGVDIADELSPGFRDRFFREELHIPDYLLENLGKAKPEEQAEIFEEIKNYVPKPKKVKPNKVTVKQAAKAASNTIDENYDVPKKFLELYYRLHDAESLMRKSWEVTFDLNPKLLTHPEQVKVLRFALKPHLEFLKTLDEVLAESSGESIKTA